MNEKYGNGNGPKRSEYFLKLVFCVVMRRETVALLIVSMIQTGPTVLPRYYDYELKVEPMSMAD